MLYAPIDTLASLTDEVLIREKDRHPSEMTISVLRAEIWDFGGVAVQAKQAHSALGGMLGCGAGAGEDVLGTGTRGLSRIAL